MARLTALRHRDFRWLLASYLLAFLGTQMQMAGLAWHLYRLLEGQVVRLQLFGRAVELGGEALGLGTLGLVRVFPIGILALFGGMVADTYDRRRLLIWASLGSGGMALLLALLTLQGRITVLGLYLLTALGAAAASFASPARQALVPNLVPPEDLTNAMSLSTLTWQLTAIVAPALAGLILAWAGPGWVYAANAFAYGLVLLTLLAIRSPHTRPAEPSGLSWRALFEGLGFVYRQKLIWSSMLLDFLATFFSSARTMLPLVAGEILGLGPVGYGLLSTAQSAGSILAGTALALRPRIRRQGPVLLASVAVYGAATALFGMARSFFPAYLFFALTGAADTVSTVIRATMRQLLTPDRLRGRMTSVNMIFFLGGPQLGEMEAGLVASVLGVPFAIVSGGLITVLLTGWIAWRYPQLRAYEGEEG